MNFKNNLINLRKASSMTQERLAELVGVSRQTVTKWESGDSLPDILIGQRLSEIFNIPLDELINGENELGLPPAPKGKHFFGVVTVGERGQIVIPKKAREVFDIRSGDRIAVLGDEDRFGIAIVPEKYIMNFVGMIGREASNDGNKN